MSTRNQTRGASTQENIISTFAPSSINAKIDQLMDMMRGLTTRMDTLEAKSRPTTSTLSTASTTSAPPAPQPQSQSQSQSTLSIAQPISQQKKKRNEKTR